MKQSNDQRKTSKKNMKNNMKNDTKRKTEARTPEEMKRAEEILLWMGDIRDDFILEAEDYKHYQNDKRVPGYFIAGGTLAAAAAVCTAIFFQTGHNRIWKDNDPMQLPYQTEESYETEWETEPETESEMESEEAETAETEETKTEEIETETTEPEITEGVSEASKETTAESTETAIQASQEVSQENLSNTPQDNGWLGQSNNYQFVVQTDESTVSVYDAWDGSLKTTIPGALSAGKKCVLLKNGERVPIRNLNTGSYQMYVGGEKQLSPETYTYIEELSDTVFTSSDSLQFGSGNLYGINGVQLAENSQIFRREGDHIYSDDAVYDLDGQLLGQHQTCTVLQEFGNYVLGCDYSTWDYILFDLNTMATVWTSSDRNLTYQSRADQTINWTNADGQCIVTDLMLNQKLTQADWFAQNAEWELTGTGTDMSIFCENEQTGQVIIQLRKMGRSNYLYYLCDNQYNIIEELPENQASMNCFIDGVRVPMRWNIAEDGTFTFTDIWTNEPIITVPIDLQGGEIDTIEISGVGPMYGITVNTMNPNDLIALLISNGTVLSESRNYTILQTFIERSDEDTLVVYESGANTNTLYFNANGEPLAEQDKEVIYADRYAVCTVQDGKLSVTIR